MFTTPKEICLEELATKNDHLIKQNVGFRHIVFFDTIGNKSGRLEINVKTLHVSQSGKHSSAVREVYHVTEGPDIYRFIPFRAQHDFRGP